MLHVTLYIDNLTDVLFTHTNLSKRRISIYTSQENAEWCKGHILIRKCWCGARTITEWGQRWIVILKLQTPSASGVNHSPLVGHVLYHVRLAFRFLFPYSYLVGCRQWCQLNGSAVNTCSLVGHALSFLLLFLFSYFFRWFNKVNLVQ